MPNGLKPMRAKGTVVVEGVVTTGVVEVLRAGGARVVGELSGMNVADRVRTVVAATGAGIVAEIAEIVEETAGEDRIVIFGTVPGMICRLPASRRE